MKTYTYDQNNQIKTETSGENNTLEYTYDIGGRITGIKTPESQKDGINREAYTYDALDYIITYADGEGHTTTFVRDPWGNALSEKDSEGITTYYTFDQAGNCSVIKDGKGNITTFTYNSLNQIRTIKDGLNQTTHYAYDLLGRMIEETDRNGDIIRYTYTVDDTLKSQENKKTKDYTQYYYRKDGLLLGAANNDGIDTFDYDQNGRVTVKNHNGKTAVEYTYNADGQVTDLKDIAGQTTQYTYTQAGLLDKVYDSGALMASYAYDKDYRLKDINFANGQSQHYSYDGDGNIIGLNSENNGGAVINAYEYTYDNNDNLLTMVQNGQTTTYTYDGVNRLKTANYPGIGQETFIYDNAGNRTKRTLGSNSEIYTYDANNRLTKITGSKSASFSYDANGNQTQETINGQTTTYSYNGFNRLKTVELPDASVQTMGYDVFGIRTYTEYQNQKTQYMTSAGQVIATIGYTGEVDARYVRGIDLLAQVQTEDTYYYHHNEHGDVTGILDAQGTVINSYTYDAFGNTLTETEGIKNVFKYAGEQYDETLGKYYLRARYYDSVHGRFTQEDTYRGDGNNLYVYVASNPLKYVDPTGHKSEGKKCSVDLAVMGISSTNKSGFKDYLWSSIKQLVLGNYTDDVTLLGTGGQIGTGFFGVDLLGDIRDISADLMNWQWSWDHAGQTFVDLAGVLPIVGTFKYTDEAATLIKGTVKTIDDIPGLNIATNKLKKKFKHAIDFGIEGNFNKTNAQLFESAIKNHVDEATDVFQSTYRGQDVYVHMKDGLGVYTDMSGEFISGWKLTQEQIEFHLKNGARIK